MSGRATIKGKGAEIFFGEDAEKSDLSPDESLEPSSDKPAVVPTSLSPDVPASGRLDVKTSASTPGRAPLPGQDEDETRHFFQRLILPQPLKRKLRGILRSERRIHTTIRFSADEMAAWRDLMYELEAKRGIKVTRNEVVRIALHLLLEDYALRKDESLLLQVLREEKEEF